MKPVKPLWEYTRDLHHACEAHIVGGAMATGAPARIWYAAWLKALLQIHEYIDPYCQSPCIQRLNEITQDLTHMESELNIEIACVEAAKKYVSQLDESKKIDGAIYVLTGAHLMGGEIMRRRLVGYPTKHLEWNDRKQCIAVLQNYRTRDDIGEEARSCFTALLEIMDEILEKYPL